METTPDKWVIIGITNDDKTFYKVFGSWAGSYLYGDSWKLNSGIESLTEDDDNYYFKGFSGSIYKCDKNNYGVATTYSQSVLEKIQKTASSKNINFIIFDKDNWFNKII
jgi:hypothetical protein